MESVERNNNRLAYSQVRRYGNMKPNTSGVEHPPGLLIRWSLFVFGLFLAIIGAYLILSGVAILKDHQALPGLLDMLVGFLFVGTGWRIISFRRLSQDA